MRVKVFGILAMVLSLALITISCSEQAENPVADTSETIESETAEVALAAPAGGWHSLSDGQRNQLILDEAEAWVGKKLGQRTGQCKEWVRTVVQNASSGYATIPSTYAGGGTYNLAKWDPEYPSSDAQAIARSTSNICNYWYILLPGRIVQMRHNYQGGTPHTMIIVFATPWGFWVVDSNWNQDLTVRSHWIDGSWLRSRVEAWTAYQIK